MESTHSNKILSVTFFSGFIGGILYANILALDYLSMTSIFNAFYLEQFMEQSLKVSQYLPNILGSRILPLFAIAILAYTKFNKFGVYSFIIWIGFLWGIYLSMGVVSLGIKGIIFCVIGILPQMFFYVPAYLMVTIYALKYPIVRWNLIKTLVVILCILCGIVIECNLSPILLKWFIGIM